MSSDTLEKDAKNRSRAAEEAEERDDDDEYPSESDSDDEGAAVPDDAATRPMTMKSEGRPREKAVIDRPSSLTMVWTIARRELASYFNSIITYIVIASSM